LEERALQNNMEESKETDKNYMEGNADEILDNESSETTKSQEEEEKEDEMKKFRSRKEEIKELKEEIKELKEENESSKDKLLRTVAEYDNFRKRTSKEKENIYAEACADVLKEMLPVLDNLERAISVDGSIEDLKKGIELTINQFESSFEKLGVEEISSDGEFDPNFHNAVMHMEDENLGKNQIAEVFLKGYKKGDKVLRYSMVKVVN